MSDDRSRSYRRIVVEIALCIVALAPLLNGCLPPDDPPLDQLNLEFLHFLTLDRDGSSDTSSPVSLAYLGEETLVIGTEHEGVYFADLTSPAKPVVDSVFESKGNGMADVHAMNGFVYGFIPSGELVAIDARLPAEPKLADSLVGDVRNVRRGQIGDLLLAAVDGFL